jgi:hypothetical protein
LFAAIAAVMIAGFIVIGVNGNAGPSAASVAAVPSAPAVPARTYTGWVGRASSSGTSQHHGASGPVLGM